MSRNKHKFTLEELGLALPVCPKCRKNTIFPVLVAYDGDDGKTFFVEEVECQRASCAYGAPKHV